MTVHPQNSAVQRLCFPWAGDEISVPLYVRGDADLSWTRSTVSVPARASASFDTYFGAFPAGYWSEYASLVSVTIAGRVEASATIRLCASNAQVSRVVLAEERVVDADFRLTAATGEWAWLWIEVEAHSREVLFADAAWMIEDAPVGSAAVCITTHNRPADCVGVLQRLAKETTPQLVPLIVVVDQGSTPVAGCAGWEDVVEELGERLRYIVQPNLGGSGGYSRGMAEALDGDARYMLVLDDDVLLEPESLARMIAFADRAERPTIVGAQMLSLVDRTLLHSYGERVRRRGFWWVPVAPDLAPIDLAEGTPSTTPAMQEVYDVDFNGWWMCLLPRVTVERVGLSLPYFIKWDDAEFGLRAAAAGTPTVTLPGAAVWHMPWTGKDDGLDWQAYYQLRNRLVTALLHADDVRGGGLLRASLAQDLNHVICLQYGSAAARALAIRDVLSGPEHLPRTLRRRVGDVRTLMRRAGQIVVPDTDLPVVVDDRKIPERPQRAGESLTRLLRVMLHQVRPAREAPHGGVNAALTRGEGKWWALGLLDSALVSSATGSGAFVARRCRRTTVTLAVDAVVLRVRLWARWPALRRRYRKALPGLVSRASWQEAFSGGAPGKEH